MVNLGDLVSFPLTVTARPFSIKSTILGLFNISHTFLYISHIQTDTLFVWAPCGKTFSDGKINFWRNKAQIVSLLRVCQCFCACSPVEAFFTPLIFCIDLLKTLPSENWTFGASCPIKRRMIRPSHCLWPYWLWMISPSPLTFFLWRKKRRKEKICIVSLFLSNCFC